MSDPTASEREAPPTTPDWLEDTLPGHLSVFSESGQFRAEKIAMWIEEALAPSDI